ncbi:MAG: YlxR family protein [Deltaproteobacteria bacterium]|nr:YlxR family protein [Deltaproteobacteria bacterium]
MALGGFLLKRTGHIPQRTCTGCKAVVAQRELVRVANDNGTLVVDPRRALPGRGAYVHAKPACVTVPGLARALKRSVTKADIDRIVVAISEMSPVGDNRDVKSFDLVEDTDDRSENAPGLGGADTVETQPAKDDRSEDARV